MVSILEHFFSLFDLQRDPNRIQNGPKMSPEAVVNLPKSNPETDLVPKCSQMAPRAQKVKQIKSKMISQGCKIDSQTTPGDQKVLPKRYFITDFQQRLRNIAFTLHFTPSTSDFQISHFPLRTLHFTLDSLHNF